MGYMRILNEKFYKLGMEAGREWFNKGIELGNWEMPANPYLVGTIQAREWQKGLNDGMYDAESLYYV